MNSGSAASIVIRNSAKRLRLAEGRVTGSRMYGLGGSTETGTVMIKQLKVDNYATTDLEFRVAGAPADKFPFDLILGDHFISKADVEFDLADGFIRMFKPQGCAPAQLVYWGKPYSQAVLLPSPNVAPATQAEVLLNGRKFTGTLDTGASQTVVNSTVAKIRRRDAAIDRGENSGAVRGLGPGTEETWTANFDSFTLGDETIGHPRIQVSQLLSAFQETYTGSRLAYQLTNAPPMLIEADFSRPPSSSSEISSTSWSSVTTVDRCSNRRKTWPCSKPTRRLQPILALSTPMPIAVSSRVTAATSQKRSRTSTRRSVCVRTTPMH